MKTNYTNSTNFPITFDRLHPGSLFVIFQERSRGLSRNRTNRTVYRKAREHEGFFAYEAADHSKGICLYPNDLVSPQRAEGTKGHDHALG